MDGSSQGFLQRLPLYREYPVVGYVAALAISCVSAATRFAVDGILPPGYPYLTFFPAVILSCFLFGRGPGIMVTVLCALVARYFFVAPFHSFSLNGGVALSLMFFVTVAAIDIAVIHMMQNANRGLVVERERNRLLAEKSELLFRELQHRVSNNLQVVAALLALQKRRVADVDARAALDEAARRLGLIGRIHRQLYDPSGSRLGMDAFLRQLGDDLIDAGGKPGIVYTVDAESDIAIEEDAAIPIALIVAEAVSNALEHGFPDTDTGVIAICLQRSKDAIVLSVRDDGKGLPDDFDLAKSNSLGLRIAVTLARQLGGRFEMATDGGTVARLILPK